MLDERFDIADTTAERVRAYLSDGAPVIDVAEVARRATGGTSRSAGAGTLLRAVALVAIVVAAVATGFGIGALGQWRAPSVGTGPEPPSVTPSVTPTPRPSPAQLLPGVVEAKIALGRNVPGGGDDIMLADWDGTLLGNLTAHPAGEHQGAFSPDGRRMAFVSDRAGNEDIYVMDLATGEASQLTDHPGPEWNPAWSPDGTRIAFFRVLAEPTIVVMDADGSGQTELRLGDGAANWVRWSPDGNWLLVQWIPDDNFDIYLVRPDGTDLQQLTRTPGNEGEPEYSPDGALIAFSYQDEAGQRDIWVMDTDGAERRRLTDTPVDDWTPKWSPDGQRLMYSAGQRGPILLVGIDGGEPVELFGPPDR